MAMDGVRRGRQRVKCWIDGMALLSAESGWRSGMID
jgi:hypothetical protein